MSFPFKFENAPQYVFVVLAIAAIIWICLQIAKTRIKYKKLRHSYPQQARNAVSDAWSKISDLEKKGLSKDEFELAKKQILETLGAETSKMKSAVAQPETPDVSSKQETRLHIFFNGVAAFGFFGIWSLGWGAGWGMSLLPLSDVLWSWAFNEHNNTITIVWKTVVLILGVLALVGFWIVPTIFAFLSAIRGLLDMITATLPNNYTPQLSDKLKILGTRK